MDLEVCGVAGAVRDAMALEADAVRCGAAPSSGK